MPRLRRRHKARHTLPECTLFSVLCCGCENAVKKWASKRTDLRERWEEHGDAVMELCVFGKPADMVKAAGLGIGVALAFMGHGGPGKRPWAWWEWDAPEPRLKIGPAPEPDTKSRDWRGLMFGVPSYFVGAGAERQSRDPPGYETELAYLRRHKLLLPGEAELLGHIE